MKQRIRVVISILVLLNICAFMLYRRQSKPPVGYKVSAVDRDVIATSMQLSGAMTREEYFRLQNIDQAAVSTGKLSDDDLDWCLRLMDLRGSADTLHGSYIRVHVEDVLRRKIVYTPKQKDKLYHQVVERVFQLKDPSSIHDRIAVAKLIRVTKDERAVPFLLPMLNERQNDYAPKFAREALDALGYSH